MDKETGYARSEYLISIDDSNKIPFGMGLDEYISLCCLKSSPEFQKVDGDERYLHHKDVSLKIYGATLILVNKDEDKRERTKSKIEEIVKGIKLYIRTY